MSPEKVLIIDDETEIIGMLRDWLEDAGYVVYSAADGLAGIREFYAQRPDIAIVDIL